MWQFTRSPIIDFTNYITERTLNFTGRKWVFQSINDWLGDPNGSRAFLLQGEPDSGKTAIAARLNQFSRGLHPPDGLTYLTSNFLSAVHFCSANEIDGSTHLSLRDRLQLSWLTAILLISKCFRMYNKTSISRLM